MNYFFTTFFWIGLIACLSTSEGQSQSITQTIRGEIVDLESQQPLIGATISLFKDSALITGKSTDVAGKFRIEEVPVGRYAIIFNSLGYRQVALNNVLVNSAKEVILNVEMEESSVKVEVVEITATKKGEALNEMATVSARTFSVDETERYAGSRGDPARMASNFAGVAGSDDSRNDIVVRGNSPLGVLYRLEGIDIPNPNHFAISGSTGGPVGILNNKVLANSDFFTSAFPAEYGNTIAAVFDMRMRNGNDEKHEYTGQFGLLGMELTGEGPISRKKGSSYLFNYRYATLDILVNMGVDIGTSAIPKYQDLSYKLNFPTKGGGKVSLFGLGGISKIDFLVSEQTDASEREIYSAANMDEYFSAGMGVAGINWTKPISDNSYSKLTLSAAKEQQKNHFDRVDRHVEGADSVFVIDTIFQKMDYLFGYEKYSLAWFINSKISARHSVKFGWQAGLYRFNYVDTNFNEQSFAWETRIDHQGLAFLVQPYFQWKFKVNEKLTLNSGLYGQYFDMTNSWAIEPRVGLKYAFKKNQSLSIGAGMHSQIQPFYVYFLMSEPYDSTSREHNSQIDFTRSIHSVVGYDVFFKKNVRIKLEAYYQYLYNIPVEATASAYSILNEGDGFDRFFPGTLVNTGTGQNYGIEFTLEKFFSRNYFFMLTGSLYDSKYQASDGLTYEGDFNGNYVLNLLGTREFSWGKKTKSTFGVGGKITWAGGLRYTPIDQDATDAAGQVVYVDSLTNSKQFKDYFRFDAKLHYRVNARKLTHEVGIDLVNLLGRKNVLRLQYNTEDQTISEVYQLGFLPLFYYRVDF